MLKKQHRGEDAYARHREASLEELGDVLWYFSTLCSRADCSLSDVASKAGRTGHRFSDLVVDEVTSELSEEKYEKRLFQLAGKVGALLESAAEGPLDSDGDRLTSQLASILEDVIKVAESLGVALEDAARANMRKIHSRWPADPSFPPLFDEGMDEDERLPRRIEVEIREKQRDGKQYVVQKCRGIIIGNQLTDNKIEPDDYRFHDVFHLSYATFLGWSPVLRALFRLKRKIHSRWPADPSFPPLFDEGMDEDERLPRRIEVEIREKQRDGKQYVVQKCRGIIIGNQLTDNKIEPDDYRFHDVFHLSYATFLGWSPVLRALFRLKRKSEKKLDENQDGARAIIIEEGISTLIFSRALKLDLFADIDKLDYDLLKSIQQFVEGYEVESCDLWQWERAILEGYKVFRKVKEHRKGEVVADLNEHLLEFRQIE